MFPEKRKYNLTKYKIPKDRIFITTDYMRKRYGRFDPNVFKRWEAKGEVEKVRNGLYRSIDPPIVSDMDRFIIANSIQEPSYVSLYSALYYYNLIPEYVFNVTSVTTKKTNSFVFRDANFSYQHLKKPLFFGYRIQNWKGEQYRIASLEKALLDFAYLEPSFGDADWLEEMRFDEDVLRDEVDWVQAYIYGYQMKSEATMIRMAKLLEVYDL
ncbi:hypothetical protein CEQ90_02590 [Lewinellaceae bacterium SD302]|nr:hypothetical protein CEQ90_02590 [Lewinellaceae bacterium SD302]